MVRRFRCSVPRVDEAWESELVVHPELDCMDLLIDVGRRSRRKRDRPVTEVHVVIFELRRPSRRKGVLDAGANRPADACVGYVDGAGERVAIRRELVVCPGHAALAVDKPAIEREAGTAGQSRNPVHVRIERVAERCANDRTGDGAAVDAAPREATFRAEHELADLIIEPDLAAAEKAVAFVRDIQAESVAPIFLGPTVTDVAADVESGPIIRDRQHTGGRRLVNRSRDVRGKRDAAEGGRSHYSDKQTTHRATTHLVLQLESSCPAKPL